MAWHRISHVRSRVRELEETKAKFTHAARQQQQQRQQQHAMQAAAAAAQQHQQQQQLLGSVPEVVMANTGSGAVGMGGGTASSLSMQTEPSTIISSSSNETT